MTLSEATSRLEIKRAKQMKGSEGYICKCPSCDQQGHDKTGSHLAIWESDGWWHVMCQKGCSESDIVSAMGLEEKDRACEPLTPRQKPADTGLRFIYEREDGSMVYAKVKDYKWEDSGWKKFYYQVGAAGERNLSHLNGQKDTLYKLKAVNHAIQHKETIYINEGEKACDRMFRDGFFATCQPAGAGPGKWLKKYTEMLKGAFKVVVVADNGPNPGADDYARSVFYALNAADIPCEVVRSATLGPKDDAYDHFEAGFKVTEFRPAPELMGPAVVETPKTYRFASDITVLDVPWMCFPYLAKGMLAGLEGDPGTGKSFMALAIAAAISKGFKLPFSDDNFPVGNSLLYMTEDSVEYTTVKRLQHLEADLSKIIIEDEVFPLDSAGLDRLEKTITETSAICCVIDPITAFIDAATKVGRPTIDVHGIMARLKAIAGRTGCLILCLRHLRKSSSGENAIYAGIGDISIIGKYRTALQIRVDPDDPARQKKLVAHVKSNIGPIGQTFGFLIRPIDRENAEFFWTGFSDKTADELARGNSLADGSTLGDAKAFLVEILTCKHVLAEEVVKQGKARGIAERTLWRAKKQMPEVKTTNRGYADKRYRWTIEIEDPFFDPNDEY